jgi:hypothetical protein
VSGIVARARASGAATSDELAALGAEWALLERTLHTTLGPSVARYLAPPHSASTDPHRHDARLHPKPDTR